MAPRPPPLAALAAGRGLLYFYDLDALGFTLDRLVGPLEDRVVPLADPILGLDHAYLALKDSTGLPLERAGQAVALLKQLGLPDMARRFSRLTTRRRGAAHPDACFVHELRAALASVDGQLLQGVAKTFGGGFGGRSSSTDVDGSDAGTASVEHSSVGTPSDYVRDKNQHVLSSGLAHPASDLPPTGGAITKDAGKTLTSDHEASDFRDLIKGDLEPPASCSSALSDEAVGTRHLVPLPGGGMQTHVGLLTGKACALDVETSAGQAQGDIRLLATDQPVDTKGLAVHQNSQDMPSLEQTLAPCTEASHRSGNVRGKTSHLNLRRIDKQIMKNTRDAERFSQRLKQASGLSQEHIALLVKERASSLKANVVLQATRSAELERLGNEGRCS